ncbi:MAG: GHKL domain-containing protein [Bacteroidetes bacterium]|nr:GHKL domain-containing protein [Bacteroidota bacterium]
MLIGWSDNAYQAPLKYDKSLFSQACVLRGNGYYLQRTIAFSDKIIVGVQQLKSLYKYNNEYLTSGFQRKFHVPDETEISFTPSKYNVHTDDGSFMFSISNTDASRPSIVLMLIIFTLYVASFLCLVSTLFLLYLLLIRIIRHRWLLLIFFIFDVIVLRVLQFYFQFPSFLYDLELFSPVYYASSEILPSLGDLLFNVIICLQLSYYLFRYFPVKSMGIIRNKLLGSMLAVFNTAIVISLFELIRVLLADLVHNSNIPLQFNQLLNLTFYSFAGLAVIVSALFAFLLLADTLTRINKEILKNTKGNYWISGFLQICYGGYGYFNNSFDIAVFVLLSFILLLLYFRFSVQIKGLLQSGLVFLFILILAVVATNQLNQNTHEKEHEQRKVLAARLSDPRDQQAEYFYRMTKADILHDSKIAGMLLGNTSDSLAENDVIQYLRNHYFSGFWNKFDVLLTVCHSGKKLNIKPDNLITDCDEYFSNHIKLDLKPVDSTDFYFLNRSVDITYYLGRIPILVKKGKYNQLYTLYIEFSDKNANRGLGYPELLMDRSLQSAENLSGYSYAFYYQGELVRNVGKYFYDTENQDYNNRNDEDRFIVKNGFSHLIHSIDNKTTLILSQEGPGLADAIAPFSFLFVILVFLFFLILLFSGNILTFRIIDITFRLRLQVFIVSLIISSSILIGGITLFYLKQLNYNKNRDIVSEKMNTVQVEMENRFGYSRKLDATVTAGLNDLLMNLSNSTFTDINIYGLNGILLSSTRTQIFEEGLVSEEMNPLALNRLASKRNSFYIHNEQIGNYSFLSAYAPLRNFDNQLIGYINLPYFARQQDLRQEMSKLLATYANLYILISALAVLLALLVSRYITRPLKLIREQIGNFRLGSMNSRIAWNKEDEIGDLVREYNRMIDELAKSAELLARSERETAWREMARQVAHEIKNPLTPIKLSMQHLIKAWDDHAPDWENRLRRFSQTLIMQIDTLSAIASEFSDFAQMPQSNQKNIDIVSVVHNSVQLYKEQENISILYPQEPGVHIVYADENQMLRVFNNLIKNSIQAIPSERMGIIKIEIEKKEKQCLIIFSDNGTGIPTEQQTRIFSPNFTTKSAGMGLGLAMVKNIVDNSGGNIWFESKPDSGTTFYILLPTNDQG